MFELQFKKIVVCTPEGDKVYTHGGFKPIDKLCDSEVWLFANINCAKTQMQKVFNTSDGYVYKPVNVYITSNGLGWV